jgi:hypothetical protein
MPYITSPHGLDAKVKSANVMLALQSDQRARNKFAAILTNTKIARAYESGDIEKFEQQLTSYFTRHHGEDTQIMQFADDAVSFNKFTMQLKSSTKVHKETVGYISAFDAKIAEADLKMTDTKTSQSEKDKALEVKNKAIKQKNPHLEDEAGLSQQMQQAKVGLDALNIDFKKAAPSDIGDKFTKSLSQAEDSVKSWVVRGLNEAYIKDGIGVLKGGPIESRDASLEKFRDLGHDDEGIKASYKQAADGVNLGNLTYLEQHLVLLQEHKLIEEGERQSISRNIKGVTDELIRLDQLFQAQEVLEITYQQIASNIHEGAGGSKDALEQITLRETNLRVGAKMTPEQERDLDNILNEVEVSRWESIKATVGITQSSRVAPEASEVQAKPKSSRLQKIKEFLGKGASAPAHDAVTTEATDLDALTGNKAMSERSDSSDHVGDRESSDYDQDGSDRDSLADVEAFTDDEIMSERSNSSDHVGDRDFSDYAQDGDDLTDDEIISESSKSSDSDQGRDSSDEYSTGEMPEGYLEQLDTPLQLMDPKDRRAMMDAFKPVTASSVGTDETSTSPTAVAEGHAQDAQEPAL